MILNLLFITRTGVCDHHNEYVVILLTTVGFSRLQEPKITQTMVTKF